MSTLSRNRDKAAEWSEFKQGSVLAALGFFLVTIIILGCVFLATNNSRNQRKYGHLSDIQHTQQVGIEMAACKTAPDPQTCMELVINPSLNILQSNGQSKP